MSTFSLFPCTLQVPCDTFQCHNRAAFFIGKEDAPKSTLTKVCDQCANELIESAVAFRDIAVQVNADPIVTDDPMTGVEDTLLGKRIIDWEVTELKKKAKELGLTGYSQKNKAELARLIQETISKLEFTGEE